MAPFTNIIRVIILLAHIVVTRYAPSCIYYIVDNILPLLRRGNVTSHPLSPLCWNIYMRSRLFYYMAYPKILLLPLIVLGGTLVRLPTLF